MLTERFLTLKRTANSITHNSLLNCFEQEELAKLDTETLTDQFIREKKKKILELVKGIKLDFDPKLKNAYDEYSEALTYLRLKSTFGNIDRIPETTNKTPDFKIRFSDVNNGETENYVVYAELKSMAYANGNLNYKDVMEQGLASQIEIEEQLNRGNKIGFGTTEIQPLYKENKKYDPTSTKYAIEALIDKISQNLKPDQFSMGETILMVDLKQLTLPSHFIEGAVPIFQEGMYGSFVSGVQWNTVFGKNGHLIYRPIEFEGKENIDGELERDGILIDRDWIKAVVFIDYILGEKEPKIVGLHKYGKISNDVSAFLHKFCDFVNDDKNTEGWVLHQEENNEAAADNNLN
jgi:hypothetical protein